MSVFLFVLSGVFNGQCTFWQRVRMHVAHGCTPFFSVVPVDVRSFLGSDGGRQHGAQEKLRETERLPEIGTPI
jgi:hypothetical protein